MPPATLLTGGREHLAQRLPEPERAVTDRQVLPIKRDDDAGRTDGTAHLEALQPLSISLKTNAAK